MSDTPVEPSPDAPAEPEVVPGESEPVVDVPAGEPGSGAIEDTGDGESPADAPPEEIIRKLQ